MTSVLEQLASRMRTLHHGMEPLILPNAWDVPSARAVERAGAAAVATTSSGVAEALGYPDGEAIPAEEMLSAVERVAAAVRVPVTADMESGYGLDAADLVAGLLQAGAVGLNLEDTDRTGLSPSLAAMETAAERIAAVREAARSAGVPVVINARVDVFLRGIGRLEERVEEAIRRGRAYLEAGADCVYPIGLTDAAAIGRIVTALDAPVNVLLKPGAPPITELARLGVRRISVGGGLAQRAEAHVEELARGLLSGDGSAFATLNDR
ncbi:MAG TPA: isocitrate lyase/phosphoenolpyruvate mutase family protein [Candidatus Limnocylindria bacterium]|nr:isocitrate lyase/phosphoenolpyruvate mutase family protein [Candidatus Limnocylindria bacterium]